MSEAAAQQWIDYEAYLAIERETDRRHEWFNGQVWAMAGGTSAHSELSAQMIMALGEITRPRGCRVHTSDMKIRVLATGLATYADTAVVCGGVERDPADRNAMTNPAVIVEVLSDSTESYDRGEKFHHYRRIASLRDYVLVSQHEPRIEVYSRANGGQWLLTVAEAGESLRLSALDAAIEVDRVYAGVELTPRTPTA